MFFLTTLYVDVKEPGRGRRGWKGRKGLKGPLKVS